MIYTGIGSRKSPSEICNLMEQIGYKMAILGHSLRSGGAPAADRAFESGCNAGSGLKEIFYSEHATPESIKIAMDLHPWRDRFRRKSSIDLQGRNSFQVLGLDLQSPTDAVICWTPDACLSHETRDPAITGGTGTAISIASVHGIKIWNLCNPEHLARWVAWVQ